MRYIIRIITFFSLVPLLVFASEQTRRPAVPPCESKSFNYVGLGVNTLIHLPIGVDVQLGRRTIFSGHHAWDRQIGLSFVPLGLLPYVQTSYLYYFTPHQGWYAGVGLTGGYVTGGYISDHSLYVNLPVTVGYHKENDDFVQLQVTPLGTLTLTYGIHF